MPPKYTNEDQNFSLFDDLPEQEDRPRGSADEWPNVEPLALNFDIFNFSMDELKAAEQARLEAEQAEEERSAAEEESGEVWPEEPAETEELPEEPAVTEAGELPVEEPEEAPVWEEFLAEEEAAEEPESADAAAEEPEAETFVEPEEETFPETEELFIETAEEAFVEPAEELLEEPIEEVFEERAEEIPEEELPEVAPENGPEENVSEEEDEAPAEDEQDRGSLASFLSLFRRKSAPEAEEEIPADDIESEEAPESGEERSEETEAKKPGKLSLDKEKLFAMLYPKKKAGEPLSEASDDEAPEESDGEIDEETPDAEQALRVRPSAAPVTVSGVEQLPREPKLGEMLVYDTELDDIDYYDDEDLPELRDYMPVRFARYGKLGIGGGLMYALFVISVSIILACAGWLFASDVLALNKPDTTAVVTVLRYAAGPEDVLNEDGDPVDEEGRVIQVDIDQVASALKSGGVIDFKWLFKLFCEVSNANVKMNPGTYDVSAKLDYRALVTEMQVGSESQEITRITFPEGYTMEQIFQLLEDNGICDKDDLYEAAANHDYSYDWLEGLPLGDASRLEGYLFPDTYDFYQGENAINAIDRFLSNFHYMLTLDMLTQAENLGMSLHEIVTVASLIEKEAGAEDDRSRFASVIYNRLDAGWKLQLDSTINYIMGTSTFDLGGTDLEIESPYNTYLYEGLPAGPICSPGKASIVAALNPASTNDWFWFAHEGITYFFSSSSAFDEFADAHRTW